MTKGKKIIILFVAVTSLIILGMAYRYSPYKVEYLGHYNKIWAHRVNSTEKLESALKFFNGIELDLVYDSEKNILDVGHPPTPSINLSLEMYVSHINSSEKPYMWLDIKNLNSKNKNIIFQKLMSIFSDKEYPLEKILVETRYPEALPQFSAAGFKTSFYMPYGLSEMPEEMRDLEIQKIRNVLNQQPNLAISSNYIDYEIMRKAFPQISKYFWITSSITKHGFATPKKILKDSTVKAVLISYKAISGNR